MGYVGEEYVRFSDVRNELYRLKGPDGVFKSENSFETCIDHMNIIPIIKISDTERLYIKYGALFSENKTLETIKNNANGMIEKVIFNPPATIVLWKDGTKTVVKTMEGTEFNAYNGFCAAVTKKMLGNNSRIHKVLENAYKDKEKTNLLLKKIKERCAYLVQHSDGCRSSGCPLFEHTTSFGSGLHNCYGGLDYSHLLEHYKILFRKDYEEDNE